MRKREKDVCDMLRATAMCLLVAFAVIFLGAL